MNSAAVISLAGFLLFAGRAADVFGHRLIFGTGVAAVGGFSADVVLGGVTAW